MELSDGKKMKAADAEAIQGRGIPSLSLMETAAGYVAEEALALMGGRPSSAAPATTGATAWPPPGCCWSGAAPSEPSWWGTGGR